MLMIMHPVIQKINNACYSVFIVYVVVHFCLCNYLTIMACILEKNNWCRWKNIWDSEILRSEE